MANKPSIVKRTVTHALNWICLQRIDWIDPAGNQRVWESAERTTHHEGTAADAVIIMPLLRGKNKPLSTLLCTQFRPPVEKNTIEFPAGLIDKGESAEDAALRELREETGYSGIVRSTSPPLSGSAGLTGETIQQCIVDIDCDLPGNQGTPLQELEAGEFIEIEEVEVAKLKELLIKRTEQGMMVDSKVWNLAEGLLMEK